MTRERTTGTRKSPPADGADAGKGVAGFAVAWKVAAFLPLVLTGAVLAGRIDLGSDDRDTSPSANSLVVDTGAPDPFQDRNGNLNRHEGKGDNDKRDKRSESPTADETSAFPTLVPTSSSPTAEDPDPTSPNSPTKSPTKGPSPTPTDTPTPEEAAEACQEAGVNPLDLEAMAECIADMLGRG